MMFIVHTTVTAIIIMNMFRYYLTCY